MENVVRLQTARALRWDDAEFVILQVISHWLAKLFGLAEGISSCTGPVSPAAWQGFWTEQFKQRLVLSEQKGSVSRKSFADLQPKTNRQRDYVS